jgi:hypothetical protein
MTSMFGAGLIGLLTSGVAGAQTAITTCTWTAAGGNED